MSYFMFSEYFETNSKINTTIIFECNVKKFFMTFKFDQRNLNLRIFKMKSECPYLNGSAYTPKVRILP